MKKLGLIGGTGPESTLIYYKELTALVRQKSGRNFFPPLTVESLCVFDVLEFCARGDLDGLAEYLLAALTNLHRAGCDFACLTGITPHIVFDTLKEKSPIPLVSMIDVSVDEAKRRGIQSSALLGTLATMNGAFFREPFERAGIAVHVPREEEKSFIAYKIESELESGIIIEETRSKLNAIIARLQAECGAQAVVLGCTELPLLYADRTPPLPALDPMRLHIQVLADMILGEKLFAI